MCECSWFGFGSIRSVDMNFLRKGPDLSCEGIRECHREVINHPLIMYYTAVLIQLHSTFLNVSCFHALFIRFFLGFLPREESYKNHVNGLYYLA